MFLRSKRRGDRLYWQVVETYREGGRVRHRTIYSLGRHDSRGSAQAAWDEAAARGDDRETIQLRKVGIERTAVEHAAHERARREADELSRARWKAECDAILAVDPDARLYGRLPTFLDVVSRG